MTPTLQPQQISVPIIGYHRSPLTQKFGIPRQPNLVAVPSFIELVAPFNNVDAFIGVEAFSHLWITWQTHHNQQPNRFKPQVRPPRLGGNTKLGVFATRSAYRPSQLGLSVVKLISIEKNKKGVVLHISGADMVDGTPIIDIKPYIVYSDAIEGAKSGFAVNKPKIKPVKIIDDVLNELYATANESSKSISVDTLIDKDLEIIRQLIAQDPRPAYRQQDTQNEFVMRYKNFDISFKMDEQLIMWIIAIKAIR